MAYTTIDKPSDYFVSNLHTGNGSTQNITGLDFAPNWVWIKDRGDTGHHQLIDTVRGATKYLSSNDTDAEATETSGLTSFNSDGFSLGNNTNFNSGDPRTYVSWNWKAGTSFTNDASSTGVGSIDSTGSVNTDAGFSIVSFTGGGANATIAHGLGVVPKMIIAKARGRTSTWSVYHVSLGATKFLRFNSTDALGTEAGWWNNTEPASSVFTIGTNHYANTQIAYCFAEKQGFSKFGSYVGNANTDGTFVYTGFKPAFVIQKASSASSYDWVILDNKRDPFNVADESLYANLSSAVQTSNNTDFLSNGFKLRSTAAGNNGSGTTYIYMAFAENPFVTSTGVPATAR